MNKEIGKEYVSVVISVTPNGTYESKHGHGLFYKFDYVMQDGTAITGKHKSADKYIKEGEDAAYVIKGSNDYGTWGSVSKPFDRDRGNGTPYTPTGNTPSGSSNKDKSIVWQSLAKVSAALLSNQSTTDPDQLVEVTDFLVSYHDWTVAGKQGQMPVFNKPRVAADMPF
jgi:hypothetical protein